MEREFENKVIIIAGGVGELGAPVTSGFVERGARVIVPFVSEMKVAAFVSQFPAAATQVKFQRVDLTNEKMVERFAGDLQAKEGRVDVLVNLTGGYEGGTSIAESEPSQFERMLAVNFTAVYLITRRIIPLMETQRPGKIVNVGSRAALRGFAGGAAYSIAKSAVVRFTEALSEEVKHAGVNVNCVLPSTIDTPRNRMDIPEARHEDWVTASDLAEVIFFLASERSRAIHGAAIPVFGRV
jgi:NAD(P)-dependent dehydrogenase (short-subunit alcohol dehydrogenase family)